MSAPELQLDELFREVVLDHYRRPRNHGTLAEATHRLEGMNPVCGDEIQLDLRIGEGRIADIAWRGQGCSISQASASLLSEQLAGAGLEEAREVTAAFRSMMIDRAAPASTLGDLEVLEGVAKFPVRVKCALLAWNVLAGALEGATPGGTPAPQES